MNRFDQEAKTWDHEQRRIDTANAIAHALQQALNIEPHHHLMEYGAGTGLVTLHFQPLVEKITAIDSSQGMLEILREKIDSQKIDTIELQPIDIEQQVLPKNQYDIVICAMTLHHLKDTAHVLSEFYKSLKPSGQLGIVDLDKEEGDFHKDTKGIHHFGYERTSIKTLARNAGFHSIEITTPYIIHKQTSQGIMKDFSLFMLEAKK